MEGGSVSLEQPVQSTALHVAITLFCILTWMSSRLENLAVYGGSILFGGLWCAVAGALLARLSPERVVGFVKVSAVLVCLVLSFEAVPEWLRELEAESRY